MIAARPNRPPVRMKCGFTLPELVVTILVSTVLIGAYVGAMDFNEAMKQTLRPPLRPSAPNQSASGIRAWQAPDEKQVASGPRRHESHVEEEPFGLAGAAVPAAAASEAHSP